MRTLAGTVAAAVPAFDWADLGPLTWLGQAAGTVAAEGWKGAMTALWSAALWLLQLAFLFVDAFTTPDLSPAGPMGLVLPVTFGVGASLALVMGFVQVGLAAWRRDGTSIGRLLAGLGQFGAVWVGVSGVAAGLVGAAAGLTRALLQALLGVGSFSGYTVASSWPRQVADTTVATVLGVCGFFLLLGALGHILVMLTRAGALMVLLATAPIAAAGLLSEVGRGWFWKALRWFLAALLIAPVSALVLGIGVKITEGVTAGAGTDTTAAVGMAVVGSLLILMGAFSPLVLFRLLAFVDPGTSSGAAVRSSYAAAGGASAILGRAPGAAGSVGGSAGMAVNPASATEATGRAAGESDAASVTTNRFASVLAGLGAAGAVAAGAVSTMSRVGQHASAVGSDVLSSGGVGHPQPYFGAPSYEPERPPPSTGQGPGHPGGPGGPGGATDPAGSTTSTPAPAPPPPPAPPTPPGPGPGLGAEAGAGAGGAGAGAGTTGPVGAAGAGGAAAGAAGGAVPVVPV